MRDRVERLRSLLDAHGVDALLVAQPENRRYVSGFTGTSGSALITASAAVFLTDFRYVDQAAQQCEGFEVVNHGNRWPQALAEQLAVHGVKALGFEQDYLTYGEVERLRELEGQVPGLRLVATSGVCESLRIRKDDDELRCIERAAAIADAAFEHILGFLRPGLTERDVALELEVFMRRQGATGPSFDFIVASGWRSALPHGVASDKRLEQGDLVTLDFGCVFEGYVSDITRTVVLGEPTDEQRRVYEVVLEAQRLALEAARPGLTGVELDAVARRFIEEQGYGEAFGHGLGHGIGLAIHEDPRVSKSGEMVLEEGMVVTIEPGIYISGWGGVRIEDDIVLTSDGSRVLTKAPKQLISIR
ncbi:MAG: aminopeptidase P family protein [Alicyclobacillaceae bacterium]|nr:aminopeptidase P family protein [Alicyclobacillaceae bacterium]